MVNNRKKDFFNKAVKMFADAGCPTIEKEYKPAKIPWKFICECGEVKEIRPHDFKYGKRCRECGTEKLRESNRMSREEIEGLFTESPNKLIDSWLSDGRTVVKYKCINGHIVTQKVDLYKRGHGCRECSIIKNSNKLRKDLDEVRKIFAEQGCELLDSVYINTDSRLKYKCSCGNISYSYINAIKKGIKCGCQRLSGENHPLWKDSITEEERILGRKYPEYRKWVKKVYEKDNYTCQKCFKYGGNLNAHHINSYADFPESRIDISNGITLCEKCHREFHNEYGYKDFRPKDTEKFLGYM